MIKTSLRHLYALAFVVLAACAPIKVKAALDIEVLTTPAGFTVWHVEDHTLPLIAGQLIFRDAGATQDPASKAGLATFVSGLLNEGAGDMDSRAFQARLDELSIRLGFGADRDRFTVSLATLTENREEAFRLMGLAINRPRFDEDAVDRVRNQMLAMISQGDESPSTVARRIWYEAAYPDHPYGHPVEGTAESVKHILRADLQHFAKTRFARDNVIIATVGDVGAEEIAALVDRALSGLPDQAALVPVPPAEAAPPAGIRVIRRPIPQSTVYFGHNGIRRDSPDWYAAYVMNYVLGGGGFASRLVNEVREKRGLAYSLASYFRPMDHGGLYVGAVGTQNERVAESIDVIRAEVVKMIEKGVTEEELSEAKTFLTGSYPLTFDTSRNIAAQLAAIQAEGFGPEYVKERNGFIEAVTLEEANAAAAKFLHPDQLFWVVVGQPDGVEETAPVQAPVPASKRQAEKAE